MSKQSASNGGEGGIDSLRSALRAHPADARSAALHKPSARVRMFPLTLLAAQVAEREGFEPSVPFPAHILSRDAQSATLSPLLGKWTSKSTALVTSTENRHSHEAF
jgi:hypothetical protein